VKLQVDINDEIKLGDQGLAEIQKKNRADERQNTFQLTVPANEASYLETRLKAVLRKAQWFINASCRTSLHRLCILVCIHTLVEVQGAGSRHSGKYYVTGVRHTIDSVSHIMDLELERNAWGQNASGVTGLSKKIF
jgi:hypothetical protein